MFVLTSQCYAQIAGQIPGVVLNWFATKTSGTVFISAITPAILDLYIQGLDVAARHNWEPRARQLKAVFAGRRAIIPITDEILDKWAPLRRLNLLDSTHHVIGADELIIIATALVRNYILVDVRRPLNDDPQPDHHGGDKKKKISYEEKIYYNEITRHFPLKVELI